VNVEHLEPNLANPAFPQAISALENKVGKGDSLATESVLEVYPELAKDRDAVLELIYTEFVLRQEAGENVPIDEWLNRFPELTKDLRDLFQVHGVLSDDDHFSGPTRRSGRRPGADTETIERVGDFELLDEIGRGGMGIVYRARQVKLNRLVALKMALSWPGRQRVTQERFKTEAEAVAQLQHPHIVQIYEVGSEDEIPYFAMEYVSGGNLAGFIRDRPLRPDTAARLIECIARAIHYAHLQGIVHRDLKPENILLAPTSRSQGIVLDNTAHHHGGGARSEVGYYDPKITDFGLAKRIDSDVHETKDGSALGTPGYMAPEQTQIDSETIGPACDIYSLGAVLYHILVGRPPFHAATVIDTIAQVRTEDPTPLRRLQPTLPRDLETICLKCLQKSPDRRYLTAADLADDLQRFLERKPIHARVVSAREKLQKWAWRHPSLVALFAVMVSGVFGIGWQWWRAELNGADAVLEARSANLARLAERAERERSVRIQYAHDVALAYHEYESGDSNRALQLLESGPKELRNWEWDYVKALCTQEIFSFPAMKQTCQDLAWSPDGKLVAVVTGSWGINEPGMLYVWEIDTRRLRFSMVAHPGTALTVDFSPTGNRIVTAGVCWHQAADYGGVRVWDAADGKELLAINGVNAYSARFSPDDNLIVVGHAGGDIVLYDSESGAWLGRLKGHKSFAAELSFRRDGKILASAGRDGTFRLWNMETKEQFAIVDDLGDVRHVAFSGDDREISVGTYDGTIMMFRQTETGVREISRQRYADVDHATQISPDGLTRIVAISNEPSQLCVARTSAPIRYFHGHNGDTQDVKFSPSGRMLATGGGEGVVKLWDLTQRIQPRRIHLGNSAYVAALAVSPDSSQIALAAKFHVTRGSPEGNQHVRLWDVKTERVTRTLLGHTGWLTSVGYDSSGKRIVSGSEDKSVRIWDVETGKLIRTFNGHTATVTCVAFVNDRVVSSSEDGTVRVWDAETGNEVLQMPHGGQPVTAIKCRDDGLIVSAVERGPLRFWDGNSGEELQSLGSIDNKITALALSADRSQVAAANDDSTIQVWRISSSLPLQISLEDDSKTPHMLTLTGHEELITSLTFSPDGQRLASASNDRTVRLWDVQREHELLSIPSRSELESAIGFSPDGNLLLQASGSILNVMRRTRDGIDNSSEFNPAMMAKAERETQDRQAIAWHLKELSRAESLRNWFAVDFHLKALMELDPDNYQYRSNRGEMFAELGQWEQAGQDLEYVATKARQDMDVLTSYFERALLRLRQNDTLGYAGLCREFWHYQTRPDAAMANSLAWTCCLNPASGIDPAQVTKLAERVVADDRSAARLSTLGACLYRERRFQESISVLEEIFDKQGHGGWPQDWAFLALAHQAQGHTETANEYLELIAEWLQEQHRCEDEGKPVHAMYNWSTRLELELITREAGIPIQKAVFGIEK